MGIKNDQAGLTLVELLVTILVASIVTLAATTVLLLGLRINNQSTKTAQGQNTVQVLMEALEDVAAEAENLVVTSEPDSWKIADNAGTTSDLTDDTVIFSYLSSTQTIYSGSTTVVDGTVVGTPFMQGIFASEAAYENQLLTIAVQTDKGNYSSTIYCRTGPENVIHKDTVGEFLVYYLQEKEGYDTVPNTITYNPSTDGAKNFLITLAKEYGSHGEIINAPASETYKYYSEWYIDGYAGHDGWNKDTPWCACFVSWALAHTEGMSNPPKQASVENLKNEFKGVAWRNPDGHYESGYLIFFNLDEDAESDHVGVVLATDANYIYTIEGNTAGKVAVRKYPKGDSRIMGFGVV